MEKTYGKSILREMRRISPLIDYFSTFGNISMMNAEPSYVQGRAAANDKIICKWASSNPLS